MTDFPAGAAGQASRRQISSVSADWFMEFLSGIGDLL
jgi:hypothetical protein